MTVKTQTGLNTDFPDEAVRGESNELTAEKLRDFIDSVMAVGETLYGEDLSQAITTSWTPFTSYDGVVNGKGFLADIPNGTLTVQEGADGLIVVDAGVSISAPGAGDFEIALTKNGGLTPFRSIASISAANEFAHLTVQGAGNLVEGDVIGLAWKATGSATVTIGSSQFRAVRP